MASPKAGINSLADVAKLATSPDDTPFGSGGPATIGHISGEFFNAMSEGKMLHVAYKAGASMTADLLGGQIPVGIDLITAFVQLVKGGQVKGLAVTSAKRSPLLPDVPTTAEAGFPYLRIDNYFGVSGPAGLTKEVTEQLYAAGGSAADAKRGQKARRKRHRSYEVLASRIRRTGRQPNRGLGSDRQVHGHQVVNNRPLY